MAASIIGSANGLRRTSGLPNVAGDYTAGWWTQIGSIPTDPDYATLYLLVDDVGTYVDYIGVFYNNLAISLDVGGTADTDTPPFSPGDWVYFVYWRSGTTHRLYVNNTLLLTVSVDVSSYTIGQLWLGTDTFDTADNAFAYFVEYETDLTSAERLTQQGASGAAHAGAFTDTPLLADFLDDSGNGHTWTEVGSVPFVASPAIPGNTSALLATVIPSLPFSTTQDVVFNGVTYTVFYTYVGVSGDNEIGVFARGNFSTYRPVTTAERSDPDTPDLSTAAGIEREIQVPVLVGQPWFFQFNKGVGNPSPAILTLDVYRFTDLTVPDGAIGVNDEQTGFPAMFVSRDTDYLTYRYVQGIANGDFGAQLADGTLALDNGNRSGIAPNGQVIIYDVDLSVLATVNRTSNAGNITSNRVDAFYIVMVSGNPSTVEKILPNGTSIDSYSITGGVSIMCVSPDDTILYYTSGTTALKRWDLVNDVALSDLVTLPAVANQTEMICLADGTVIILIPSLFQVLRYSAAGALLNTYQFPITISTFAGNRLAHDTDPDYFWMRDHIDSAFNKFFRIHAATGVMTELRHVSFLRGVYGETTADATPTPLAPFGVAESCPMWIVPGDVPPPPEPPEADALGLACPAGVFTLTGTNFDDDTIVTVTKDDVPITPVTITGVTATTLTFTLPVGTTDTPGTYCVTVSDGVNPSSTVCNALSCPGGGEGCPPDWPVPPVEGTACAPAWPV